MAAISLIWPMVIVAAAFSLPSASRCIGVCMKKAARGMESRVVTEKNTRWSRSFSRRKASSPSKVRSERELPIGGVCGRKNAAIPPAKRVIPAA